MERYQIIIIHKITRNPRKYTDNFLKKWGGFSQKYIYTNLQRCLRKILCIQKLPIKDLQVVQLN